MKESLFRAWCPENKKMYYIVSIIDKEFFDKIYSKETRFVKVIGEDAIFIKNDYEHIMLSLGIKDKNGNIIYEGDIIKTIWQHCGVTNYEHEAIGLVIYSKETVGFVIHTELYSGPLISHEDDFLIKDKIEIIGNIYQNPELKKDLYYGK